MRLDDPERYKQLMTYPLRFVIYAQLPNREQYEMRIVAKTEEQAEEAARRLCDFLGLEFSVCFEED